PSAMSTPAICARYLVRSGASLPDAVAAVGVAQTVQFLVTVALFTGFGLTSGWTDLLDAGSLRLGLILGAVLLVYLLTWLAIRRSARAARLAQHARHGLSSVIAHVRARPGVAVAGIVASAVLTAAHIAAFALCVRACGGHASITTLAAVYLAAAAAGSVIPTPGGTGAIEATMITGLTVAGIPLPVATAATVLSRLVSVWTLVPPGWLALISLRRRGLV
ncbi:MAG TPA: flippase-like domain-containing protein, partial [Micromonosporaceae bacterium]